MTGLRRAQRSVPLGGTGPPRQDRLVVEEPPQVLGHRLGRRVAVARVLLDRLEDDRLQVAGDARVDRSRPGRLDGLDLLGERHPVGRVEGRPQHQQLVEGQAQRVEVGPGVPLAAEPLGGHVAERAQDVAGPGQVVVVDLGQAEVADPDDALGVEQEVRRLDVAVEDAAGVRVGQGRGRPAGRCAPRRGGTPGAAIRPTRAGSRPASRPRSPRRPGGPVRTAPGRPGSARRRRRRRIDRRTLLEPAGQQRSGHAGLRGDPARARVARPVLLAAGRGRRLAPPEADRPRSRRSSSMTASRLWPWMNCIA